MQPQGPLGRSAEPTTTLAREAFVDERGGGAPSADAVLAEAQPRLVVSVHDASRLGWNVTVPFPDKGRAPYVLEVELEAPANVAREMDPWAALQSYARLECAEGSDQALPSSLEAFRQAVVTVAFRLSRAREGFIRHCTIVRASPVVEDNHLTPLVLWLGTAANVLAAARTKLPSSASLREEAALADEFLSGQFWTVLTDCGRALVDTRRALEERLAPESPRFDCIEAALVDALNEEMSYRRKAQFSVVEPANTRQLERLFSRMRWLKKHFEHVLFLDGETYHVANRWAGWFSALTAMVAYLWFLAFQLTLERHPAAIGSGVVAFALLSALAYASRERLKEIGRNWLAGRIQQMFAQRVTRYRILGGRRRAPRSKPVIAARESFSQSSARRPDPVRPESELAQDVTLLRFVHRGHVGVPDRAGRNTWREARLIYRLDLSSLFPRLHDAVRGLASVDRRTGTLAIVDVPRNYELPLRASLRWSGGAEHFTGTLVINKNGLVRLDDDHE